MKQYKAACTYDTCLDCRCSVQIDHEFGDIVLNDNDEQKKIAEYGSKMIVLSQSPYL